MTNLPLHGGGLDGARHRWPNFMGEWLDLSTGINPHPYPIPSIPPDLWTRLPDTDLFRSLILAARTHYQASSPDRILAAPGSGALIRVLPTLVPVGNVAVIGPTYSEHAHSWKAAGHRISLVSHLEDSESADTVIIVNPNNPNGRTYDPATLIEYCQANPNKRMIVDQAFADLTPQLSIIPHLPPNCIALTSFGKFYGLAGLRLGFAFATPDLLSRLSEKLGPWPVSGPALWIGTKAMQDHDWCEEARISLAKHRAVLDASLHTLGLDVIGGTDLFRLVKHNDAALIWETLGQSGILTRVFDYDPTWLRIGLPANQKGIDRLLRAFG